MPWPKVTRLEAVPKTGPTSKLGEEIDNTVLTDQITISMLGLATVDTLMTSGEHFDLHFC